MKSDEVQNLKNHDGKTLKVSETLDFDKAFKRRLYFLMNKNIIIFTFTVRILIKTVGQMGPENNHSRPQSVCG